MGGDRVDPRIPADAKQSYWGAVSVYAVMLAVHAAGNSQVWVLQGGLDGRPAYWALPSLG